jgi:hypothetical protein
LEPTLSDFAELLKIAKQLKQQDRSWTDELSQDALLLGQSASKRKDSATEGQSKVAYFLIDPLCHEMAKEFFSELQNAGSNLQKAGLKTTVTPSTPPKARSAELPPLGPKKTETAPSTQAPSWPLLSTEKDFQRFRKDLKSLKTDESSVRKSEEPVHGDKASSPRQRVEFLKLREVCAQTAESLEQRCSEAGLIVVDAKELNELDESTETKISLVAFGHWIEQVQGAWDRLHNLGVQEFVFITGNAGQSVAPMEEPSAPQESPVPTTPQERSNHDRYRIEAEAKPEMLGYSRLQIRVRTAPEGHLEIPHSPEPKLIHVALRVPERPDIQVTIKDAPGAVMNNLNKHQLAIALNQDWTEVLFDLIGPEDERIPVEVYFPEAEAETESATPEAYFRAVGASPDALQEESEAPTTSTPIPVPIPQSSTWQDSFEDENIRTVFIHLQRHGSVTEHELTQFLGGARKARSFSLAFEEYLKKVPFSVRIETTASGKRYVKET